MTALLTALLGACVMAAVLRQAGPSRTDIAHDRERVELERSECEVLFVGPSYVIAQVFPDVFDAEARRLGEPIKSCTFGAIGLRSVELRVHLRALLEQPWPKLQLVVVDVSLGDDPGFSEGNWFQPRFIQWHTWASMSWLADYQRRGGGEVNPKHVWGHLAHLGANYLNLGAGVDRASSAALLMRMQHGLGLLEGKLQLPAAVQHAQYLRRFKRKQRKNPDAYIKNVSPEKHQRKLAQLIGNKRRSARNSGRSIVWPLEIRTDVRSFGYDAVFLQAPVWKSLPSRMRKEKGVERVLLFDFNHPERYPELYQPAHRGGSHHLNFAGSEIYSRLLARELLAAWRPRR